MPACPRVFTFILWAVDLDSSGNNSSQGQALKKSLRTDYLKILLKFLWRDLQFKQILRELLEKFLAKKVNQASEAVDLHPIVEPQIHSRLGSLI